MSSGFVTYTALGYGTVSYVDALIVSLMTKRAEEVFLRFP